MTAVEETVWLSRKSAAKYLGMSEWSIDRYVERGHLPAFKAPGASNAPVRFKITDLDALLVPVPRMPGGRNDSSAGTDARLQALDAE